MITSEIPSKNLSITAIDNRATPRLKAHGLAKITNLTRGSQHESESAQLLDVSVRGMKIETALIVLPGDALRIDLSDSILLAEAQYCAQTAKGHTTVGLKLFHSLRHADLRKYVEPELWNSFPLRS